MSGTLVASVLFAALPLVIVKRSRSPRDGDPMHSPEGLAAERSITLPELAAEVRRARDVVHARRTAPVNRNDLALAHRSLLQALEAYVCELAARHLPIPPRLRDDLRLQRKIGRQPTWTPPPWTSTSSAPPDTSST